MSLLGLIGGFSLAVIFFVQNVVYLQIFLAATAVNIILLAHIVLALIVQELYMFFIAKKKRGTSTDQGSEDTGPTLHENATEESPNANSDELPPAPPSPAERHARPSVSRPLTTRASASSNRKKSRA